jgi:hypothetical protein
VTRGAFASLAIAVFSFASAQPDPIGAQQVSLRLGALHARYSDSINGTAGSLGARLAWNAPRSRGAFETSWAQFSGEGGAGQGWGSISFLGPSTRSSALGVRADGVANVASGVPTSGSGSAEIYAVHVTGGWTFGASAGGGGVRNLSAVELGLATASLQARLDVSGSTAFTITAATTTARGTHFTDATLTGEWQNGRYRLSALAAARGGDLSYKPWAQAWGGASLTPRISLEFSAGSYPRDLTGLDHGVFASAGLRINLSSRNVMHAADAVSSAAFIAAATRGMALRSGDFIVEPLDSAATRITLRVGSADSVAIGGDWNEWRPTAMAPDGAGRWTAIIPAGAGAHRFALKINGGDWFVPASVTKLPDDFGGEVGLLVVH